MEEEAKKHGATGITGVISELRTLAGYTEFLSQGTSVQDETRQLQFFSSAASGIELYCHLDAGYVPHKFVMGNIAYALGVGPGRDAARSLQWRAHGRHASHLRGP
jgi:hypothetical protein